MRIAGLIIGTVLAVLGGMLMLAALWNGINTYVFSDELPQGAGKVVGPIALAAVPLVIGLLILARCQKPPQGAPPIAKPSSAVPPKATPPQAPPHDSH